ncbi:MAG: SpoIIE family protein phosphatase [Bacteroidetes bacterium]|nr:SpoIIE family protein phosphatase [Bacteroidota bacterium]
MAIKNLKKILVAFLLLTTKSFFSQEKLLDSLINSLSYNTKPDSNRLKKLVKISGFFLHSDHKKSEKYILEAIDLTKTVNNVYWKSWALYTFAELEGRKGNFINAIKFNTIASRLFDSIHQNLLAARCEYVIATSNLNIGNYNEGLSHIIIAEKKFMALNNLKEASNAMIVKSSIYSSRNQFDLQKKELLKCMDIKKTLHDSDGLVCVYAELAIPLICEKNLNEAEKSINNALNILHFNPNPYYLKACYGNLGYIFLLKKDFKKAIESYNQSLEISIKFSDKKGICESNNKIAELYLNEKDAAKSLLYAERALKISKETSDLKEEKFSYELISKAYELKGDYVNSLSYHKKFKQAEDSLLNETNMKSLNEVNIKFETEKKEQENKLLHTQNQLSTETIKQQRLVTYFVIAGLLFVAFLAAFIFNGLKKQRKANKIISLQKTEVERQKHEVEKQKHLVEEHQKEILDSIHYAKRIQTALLANKEFVNTNIKNNFIYFQPKDIVSGDFYWATQQNDCFYLACCDSTGHGVPGAFMSLLNIGFLSEAIKEKNISKPNEIFNYVRQRLIDSISAEGQKDGFDGILIKIKSSDLQSSTESITIEYAAANNEPILISNNQITELPKDKMPVGQGERKESFALHTLELKKGETLYLYTDGYADQFGGEKGKKFKYKQLNELLLHIHQLPMQEQEQKLSTTFNNWKGSLEQVDDVCVIGIKI